jgi:hypothetical protein
MSVFTQFKKYEKDDRGQPLAAKDLMARKTKKGRSALVVSFDESSRKYEFNFVLI